MITQSFHNLFSQILGVRVDSIERIEAGCSTVPKYKLSFNGRQWMVKIIEISPTRIQWYNTLYEIDVPSLVTPLCYSIPDSGGTLLISPWIDGIGLDKLIAADLSNSVQYGKNAAKLLKLLHSADISISDYAEKLKEKVENICNTVVRYQLTFPGKDECINFVKNCSNNLILSRITLLHRDIRPENFIVCNDKLYLIDFDNGGIGEPEADFAYLTAMGEKSHRIFAKSLIAEYLSGYEENAFWEKNLFYSTLQVMEYAIWKWETKQKQVSLQAQNLLHQYKSFTTNVPLWWK